MVEPGWADPTSRTPIQCSSPSRQHTACVARLVVHAATHHQLLDALQGVDGVDVCACSGGNNTVLMDTEWRRGEGQ